MWFRRRRRIGPLLIAADRARAKGDWSAAARGYEAVVVAQPDRADIWVQLGHSHKETGNAEAAAEAYRRAADIQPGDAETWLHLADILLSLDRREAAIDAFVSAAERDPRSLVARNALEALGAHDRVPVAFRSIDRQFDALQAIESSLAATREALAGFSRTTSFPIGSYDDFRHAYPIGRPPAMAGNGTLSIVVRAWTAQPWELRATLESLRAQSNADWTATILAGPVTSEHPVAGMGVHDSRMHFRPKVDDDARAAMSPVLLIEAGMVLDPEALAWFEYAATYAEAALVRCDQDRMTCSWRGVRRYGQPSFHAIGDDLAGGTDRVTPGILYAARILPAVEAAIGIWQAGYGTLEPVMTAAQGRGIGHLSRLLASRINLPPNAVPAPVDEPTDIPGGADFPAPVAPSVPLAGRIGVIIPTRDQAMYLRRCIESLRDMADAPADIDIVVVDNRSRAPETIALFAELALRGVRILPFDEPFNWSRANNLGAASLPGCDLLVFVNNDIEMTTTGWDRLLRCHLADPGVGLAGARLMYPDGSIQHVGIVLGMNGGEPMHEAVGAAGAEPGPEGRWLRSRNCAAVTGAFMAMRRSAFAAAAGFEENGLPLGYNDIDMCLRIRDAGLRVRMMADVQMVHHESKTRGLNVTQSQIAWDTAELAALYARWGAGMMQDPGYNAHWNRHGRPFESLREPTISEVMDRLIQSVHPNPWAVVQS